MQGRILRDDNIGNWEKEGLRVADGNRKRLFLLLPSAADIFYRALCFPCRIHLKIRRGYDKVFLPDDSLGR